MKGYPRREFLLSVLAACGTPLLVGVPPARGQTPGARDRNRRTQTAVDYFGGVAPARATGEVFMSHLQLDITAESIQEAARVTLDVIAQAPTRQAALTALGRAVRRDFQEGRTIELQGWVLSRTELELCALTLLSATDGPIPALPSPA